MLGFNMKDENGQPLYKELSFEELEKLVADMKAFAASQPPFDYTKAVAEAQANEKVSTEMVGPILRVRGEESIDSMKEYNKFVRIGLNALQLCYYEMQVPNVGKVGQLTIVDNFQLPLKKELVLGFVDMFFDYRGRRWQTMETPAHVAVVIEPKEEITHEG